MRESRMPFLEHQFHIMTKGAERMGLGTWVSRFEEMREAARDGAVTADQLAELVDYDYRTGQDPKAGATTLFGAVLADTVVPLRHRAKMTAMERVLGMVDANMRVQRGETGVKAWDGRFVRRHLDAVMSPDAIGCVDCAGDGDAPGPNVCPCCNGYGVINGADRD